jgi:hypothetical protein
LFPSFRPARNPAKPGFRQGWKPIKFRRLLAEAGRRGCRLGVQGDPIDVPMSDILDDRKPDQTGFVRSELEGIV